jgi:hypothetical protein
MMPITKEIVARAVIDEIEKDDEKKKIETGLAKNYYNPATIVWKSSQNGFIPDIKVSSSKGKSDIYEIEISDNYNEEKWKLFSLYTKKSHGRFYLIVPESKVDEITLKITNSKIHNIHLLTIPI